MSAGYQRERDGRTGEYGAGGSRQFNNQRGGYDRRPQENYEFPADYLKNGYCEQDGGQSVKYITTIPESIGKALSIDSETSRSKIRSYFDYVESIYSRLQNNSVSRNRAIIELAMLKPRVNSRFSKKTASRTFKQFIDKNVDYCIKDTSNFKRNLKMFKEHFEAVICYTNEDNKRN